MNGAKKLHQAILLVLLLCASPCFGQVLPYPSTCAIDKDVAESQLREVIPKLQFLQQILDKNFSEAPPPPRISAFHNATKDSVTFLIDLDSNWATEFRVNYFAEVALVAPVVITTIVPAFQGDFFNYKSELVLSGSNFVPNTRYFYSAISSRNVLNQQSRPSQLKILDYLPQFALVNLVATIASDKTPQPLDISFRNFESSVVITLISPSGIAVNLTYQAAPDDGTVGRLSTIFVARVQIPALTAGGTYAIRFILERTSAVITRTLNVLAPFRPRFELSLPAALPLAGGIVRVLLSRVIYPVVLASTVVVDTSNSIVAVAALVETSPSGPQDFFVTFNFATPVNASSVVNYTIIPNGEPKASVQFSVVYSAVRLLSVSPSVFSDRPTNVTVSFAVDAGTPMSVSLALVRDSNTPSPISIADPFASDVTSALSLVRVSSGTFSVTLNFAGRRIVGHYAASLTISFGSLPSATIVAPFEVRSPPPATMILTPASILDDIEYNVAITVSNIGDIRSTSNLVVTCGSSASCRCSVSQFSISFASLNCAIRAAADASTPAPIGITVNNTNIVGFGVPINATLLVLRATMPRLIATSSNVFTPLGRLPLAFAVANFDAVNVIRIAGVTLSASNYTLFQVVKPFNSSTLSSLQGQVKSAYASEQGFVAAFDAVALELTKVSVNAIICLLRMPRDANLSASSSLVTIQQTSPSAMVSFQVSLVPVLNVPILRLSVSQISLSGGTSVSINIRNYIPITQISDIDIIFVSTVGNQTNEIPLKSSLTQSLGVDAIVTFESPVLSSTQDAPFKIVSKIDSFFGTNATGGAIVTPIVVFSLPVFDPRKISVQSFNQKTLYSIGGPRNITFFVNFVKVLPVAVTVNLLECEVIASPSLIDIRLQPDKLFAITVAVKDFPASLTGNVDVLIFSGNEQANATLNVITPPTTPVLAAQQGNDRIPSTSSDQRVTVSFRQFIASASTSNFFVFLDTGAAIAVKAADVTSDFTITTLSFTAPAIGSLSSSEPARIIQASVADFSSGCGRNRTCVGNFTLRYVNADLASFVAMNPTNGAPSIVNSVVVVVNNIKLTNASLITVETTSTAIKSNVVIAVLQASLAGPGLSAQSFITLQISWVTPPRPSIDTSVSIRLKMESQVLDVPTPFVFFPDNRPQLLSISPKSVTIDGGSHSCAFIQPAAFNFVSAKVFVGDVEVSASILLNGSLINFASPGVAKSGSSLVIFSFQGIVSFNVSDTIFYNAPPPIVISSIFPPDLSSFGSSAQVTLKDIPRFWSLSSLRASLVSGVTSATCQVASFTPSTATVSINCPSIEVGFYVLEISDLSAIDRVARSSSVSVFNPLAPKFRSIFPSQIFLSKSTQMSIVYEQYPVGSIPAIYFSPPGSTSEIDVPVLSQFLEPTTTSSTVCTFIVNSPVSIQSFSIRLSVRNSLGTTFSTSSPVINAIDDSNAVVLSVLPASINSVGGSVEVRLGGYPSGILASDVSVMFTVNDASLTANVLSFAYSDTSRVTLQLAFAAFDIASSSRFDVSIKPKGFDSKVVIFPLSVVKVSPAVISVTPSVVVDSGSEIVQVRIAFFPIITSSSQVSVSIGGFVEPLTATLLTSTADVTVISVTTSRVSIASSGIFSLLLRNILTPAVTLSSQLSIQLTEKVLFITQLKQSVNSGIRTLIPFTLFLPESENLRFKDIMVGRTFNQDSQQVLVILVPTIPKLGDLYVDPVVNRGNVITILRRDVPYKGCITFGVTLMSVAGLSGPLDFQIYYSEIFPTASRPVPVLGLVSVEVLSRFISLSPSSGAASGGYTVSITVSGLQSFANASVFFGNSPAVVVSQTAVVSSGTATASSAPVLLVTVTCPSFPVVSDVEVTVRVNGVALMSSMFAVTLGCPDYNSFCRGLPGGFIANAPLISRSPPADPVCSISYCSDVLLIAAPVLVSFPGKQSTLVSTISFTVQSLFVASASQIRVVHGSSTLLAVQSAVYSAQSVSFAVTVQSPTLSEYRTLPITVYSALVGIDKNATFMYTSVPPITGPVRVSSIRPSIIPFEGTTFVSIDLTNFPFTAGAPTNSFAFNASTLASSINIGTPAVAATLVSSTDFGNATVQVSVRPSSFLNGSRIMNLNLLISALSNVASDAASVSLLVSSRIPRRFSAVATNAINTTSFRSIPGTLITLAAQGFTGPNITVCFGFRDPVSRLLYDPSCGVDCVTVRNAIDVGDPVSFITVSYPRDYLQTPSFFNFSPRYGELHIFIYDQIIPTTAGSCLSKQQAADIPQFECSNCLTFHPLSVPSLLGSSGTLLNPVQLPFAVVGASTLSASEVSFSFLNFFNPQADNVSSISAFIVTGDGPDVNAIARPAPGCPESCRISVLIGGRAADAKLVGKIVDVRFVYTNSNGTSTIVVKTRFLNPPATAVPSLVSSSGGTVITVTSYAFSLLSNTTTYRSSKSAFTILSTSKVGIVGTRFVIQINSALKADDVPFRISCNECQTDVSDDIQLEIFAALVLSSPPLAVSSCRNGDRQIQMLLSNLPISLSNIDSFSVKFNKIDRPFVLVSNNVFNFSFSCTEDFPSLVPLEVFVLLNGGIRPASSIINLPPLPIKAFIQGANIFRKRSLPSTVLIAADTLLVQGQFSFDIVLAGTSDVISSPSVAIIRSDRVSSLLSFQFDPRSTMFPPGAYNFVLTARTQSSSIAFSVIDPDLVAVCLASSSAPRIVVSPGTPPVCALNAVTGGSFSINVTNPGGFSFLSEEIVLTVSREDGSPVPAIFPSLSNFSNMGNVFNVVFNPYLVQSDFIAGFFNARLSISSIFIPQARFTVNVALRSDPRAVDVSFADDSLIALSVSFNQPIAISRSEDCSRIFAPNTVARLGVSSRCIFRQSSVLILLGSGALIVVGDVVSILNGTVAPADGFPIFNSAQSLAVSAIPSTFRAPDATISGTRVVEACTTAAPARLVATMPSPRRAAVSWSCISVCGSSLSSFISTLSTSSVSIPARLFDSCTQPGCGIVATFVDFLDRKITTPAFFVSSNPVPAPLFDLNLPFTERVTPSNVISLKTQLTFSSCSPDSLSTPVYSWSLSGPTQMNTSLVTGPAYNFRPNTLLPGSYTVTVTVFIDGMTATVTRPMVITSRALVAAISAPRVSSTSKNFTLDAQNSRDLETTISPRIPLLFVWSCFDQNGLPCVDRMNLPLVLNRSNFVTITANTLPVNAADNTTLVPYIFRLSVTNAVDSRVASAEVVVNIVADSVPAISVTASTDRVNAGSLLPIILNANVDDPALAITWSESSGLLENFLNVIDPAFTNRQARIIINPASFVAGQTYVFVASVDTDRRASAAASIIVNSPPSSGTCSVSSILTQGISSANCNVSDKCDVSTSVTVTCSNWNDKDLPLRYEYGYVSSTGARNSFDYVLASSQSFNLPIGSHTIFVNVCDKFFACASVARVNQVPLQILPVKLGPVAETALVRDVARFALSGNVEGFCTLLSSAVSYFTSTTLRRNRHLLSTFANDAVSQIGSMTKSLSSSGSNVEPGAAGSLIQASANVVSNLKVIDPSLVEKLLPSMITLSSALGKDAENIPKVVSDASNIVNVVSGMSSFDSVGGSAASKFAANFADLRSLENNMLSATLLGREPGQSAATLRSADGTYMARALKVPLQDRNSQDVSIQSPALPSSSGAVASAAQFDLSVAANRNSNLNVRSSTQLKSKWDKVVAAGSSLLSDLIDCTVYKDDVSLTQPSDVGSVRIQIEFPLNSGTGAGSQDAFARDKASFKLMFVDGSALSDRGCSGTFADVPGKPMAGKFTGTCNHLTAFGIVASTPSAAPLPVPPQPIPVPGPNPVPVPIPANPVSASAPPADPSSNSFPVWASVLIAVGGAALVAFAALILKKYREKENQTRVKQIVASSLWKQSLASSKSQDTKPALAARVSPANERADAFSPMSAASTSNASPPPTRRQLLADLAGAIAMDEASAKPVSLPLNSPSHSPLRYREDAADNEFDSSLYHSAVKTPLDSGAGLRPALASSSSLRLPDAEFSPKDSSSKLAVNLPRRKSPYSSPGYENAQSNSAFAPSRSDSAASASRLSDKTVRQQLADLAAAAAAAPLQLSPYTSSLPAALESSRAPRSVSRGRIFVPDLDVEYSAATPSAASKSASSRGSRQLMAELAASGAAVSDFEPRPSSPFDQISSSDSSRLPRSRSRPILDDPEIVVQSGHTSPSASRPHSRYSSPPVPSLSSRREASLGRGVPDPDISSNLTPPPRRLPANSGSLSRKPSVPSRQGFGGRYDQA